jgi:hypothetical protein
MAFLLLVKCGQNQNPIRLECHRHWDSLLCKDLPNQVWSRWLYKNTFRYSVCLIFSKGRYAPHQYFPGSDGQTTRDWEANARLAHQPYILIVPAAQQQKSPEYQAFANHNVIETEYETFFNHVVIECTKKKCANPSNFLVDYSVLSRNLEYNHGHTQIDYLCRTKKSLIDPWTVC